MKQFVLLFRMDITSKDAQPNPEQMKVYMNQWMLWINKIKEQGQLANGGNHLSKEGKVLRSKNNIIDGPYQMNKESVTGYIIILAKNFDEALRVVIDCPILQGEGTSVEVREIAAAGI
jgi:hypothetical protein